MISDGEILSFIEDKIIVKDENEKIVYSNIDNPLSFEQSLIVKGKFRLNENTCYTVSYIKRLAKDNNYYTITMYKPCKVNDYLTGVMTRENFEDVMSGYLKKNFNFIIIIGDVDNFKMVNDTYGHRAGDQVLKSIGKILNNSVRNTDIVGRYGGEEFSIILPFTKLTEAKMVAERLRKAVEATHIDVSKVCSADKNIGVTISLGIAEYKDGDDEKTLLQKADKALYIAKEAGRNRSEVYEEV